MAPPPSPPPPAYRKLTGLYRGLGTMTQLWQGGDHVLHVMSTGYTETYRRFYLRDIQTILLVHTARRTYLAVTLSVLLLIALMIVVSADGGRVAYGIMAAVFLPLFLWNHLLGPGSRAVVVTAVQQESVPSLCRLAKSRRVIGQLKPLIEAAQAELAAAAAGPAAPAASVPLEFPPPANLPAEPPPLPSPEPPPLPPS